MDERYKSVQTLYHAEERGDIPKANRVARGSINARSWMLSQLPAIGRKFGFLPPPTEQIVICKYIQKGGVLKTTTSFNEARIFALNGLKTLIIGQDFECSITDILAPQAIEKLEKVDTGLGLFHFFAEDAPLENIIRKTSLPTLDIIPETHDLVVLDKWLNQQTKRESVYTNKLIPMLSQYEVIIFDNGPSWNYLIENSIASSKAILCPLGCNLLAYNASETNFSTIVDFKQAMDLHEQKLIMFPTLLERSSLSQQIYGQYLTRFSDYILPIPIRASVKGQEALIHNQTIFEYAPRSSLADDYYDLIKGIWGKLNNLPINTATENES